MVAFAYLAAILFSFAGMLILDRRYSLAFFHDTRRTAITLLIGVAVFVIWDIFGIGLGIFFSGDSPFTTGWYLGPEFPVEELAFLTFLCYFTLITYRLWERRWQRT